MIDEDKLKSKIQGLKSNLIHGACSSQIAMETRCKEEAYNEVLTILNSMQKEPNLSNMEKTRKDWKEEPVSDDLEEAANNALEGLLDKYDLVGTGSCLEMFKLGAEWGKNQAKVEIQAQSMALAHGCPKEPVNEDLEEAAENALNFEEQTFVYDDPDTKEGMTEVYTREQAIYMFKAGAKWQKEQMIKDAIETTLSKGLEEDYNIKGKYKAYTMVIKED